jgi:hypothetical protein
MSLVQRAPGGPRTAPRAVPGRPPPYDEQTAYTV